MYTKNKHYKKSPDTNRQPFHTNTASKASAQQSLLGEENYTKVPFADIIFFYCTDLEKSNLYIQCPIFSAEVKSLLSNRSQWHARFRVSIACSCSPWESQRDDCGKEHSIRPSRKRLSSTSSSRLPIGGPRTYEAERGHRVVGSDRDPTVEIEGNLPAADATSDTVAFCELWSRLPFKHRVISSRCRGERSIFMLPR